ncbi:MAG: phage portal protein [Acidobacteriota bacterium]
MSEAKKTARFRPAGRVVNPRTGQDDGKTPVTHETKYVPTLGSPARYAQAGYLDPWLGATQNALGSNVGGAEVSPIYEPTDPTRPKDDKKILALKAFLEADPRTYSTPEERLEALALDYRIQGYCVFEIARDADRKPSAWYHVPAATIRVHVGFDRFDQVDETGRVIGTFGAYAPNGRPDGRPELMLIRRYDPTAKYVGAPGIAPLLGTLERLAAQDAYNTKLLRRGGVTPWLLFLREALDDESFARLKDFLKQLESGPEADLVGILDGVGEGADLKTLVEGAAEMTHTEGEKLMRDRVLAVQQVPPTKVSLSASNYATAYQEDQTFRFQVVQPILRRLLKRLSVVAREITGDAEYRYTFRQQSLEDYLQLVQAEDILMTKAVHTINDTLARLGMPGIGPLGDARIAFTNQGPVRLEDLVNGNLPPTPGRIVDSLLSLRRAIEEAQRAAPPATPSSKE